LHEKYRRERSCPVEKMVDKKVDSPWINCGPGKPGIFVDNVDKYVDNFPANYIS